MNPDLSISNCFSILDSLLSNSLILIQLFVKRWPSIGSNENWESLLCVLLWKSVLVPIEFSGMLDPWRPGGCQQLIWGSLDCTELTGSGTNANAKSIIRNTKSKTNAGKTLTGSEVQKYYKQFSNTTSYSYLYQHDAWRRVWATAQCVLCSVYFSAQPNKLRPIKLQLSLSF